MRIYDTFIFGSDLDMLECRLSELAESPVYRHVLVEAPFTHQGKPKPFCYADNRERFAAWEDRIIHVIADIPGPTRGRVDPWVREHRQRAFVYKGLAGASPEDIVWLCDVDEIPSRKMWDHVPSVMTAWEMRLSMFAVDWVYPVPTRVAMSGRFMNLTELGKQRDNAYRGAASLVRDAGWHFTWLGGPEAIREKMQIQCHLELNDLIAHGLETGIWYEQGYTWHGQNTYPPQYTRLHRQDAVEVDDTWPVYIRDHYCPPEWFRPRESA